MRQSCGVSYSQFTLPEETTVSSCCAEIDCRNDNQAELWMELLTPDDGTRTLLRYQHPAWGEYAAATEADYGQGRALYVGFLPQKGLISQLFDVLTADLTLNSRTSAYRYPLVVKKMRNRAGNNIHFLFNYSGEAMDVVSETTGTALLSGRQYTSASRCASGHGNLLSSKANDAAALGWKREWNWISMSYSISRH